MSISVKKPTNISSSNTNYISPLLILLNLIQPTGKKNQDLPKNKMCTVEKNTPKNSIILLSVVTKDYRKTTKVTKHSCF